MPLCREFIVAIVFLTVLCGASPAFARSCRTTLVPNGSKFSCQTCHTSNLGGQRNVFGLDVQKAINGSGSCAAVVWGPTLAVLDSDGDGVSNGAELLDPEGTWKSGQPAPGPAQGVTNPGVKDATPPARFLRADYNDDGLINVTDAIATIFFLVQGGKAAACSAAADANSDGKVDLSDAVYTLDFLFSGGRAPVLPFPGCANAPASAGCTTVSACD